MGNSRIDKSYNMEGIRLENIKRNIPQAIIRKSGTMLEVDKILRG